MNEPKSPPKIVLVLDEPAHEGDPEAWKVAAAELERRWPVLYGEPVSESTT